MELGFVGFVKQAPHQYTIAHLKSKLFTRRGGCYGLVSEVVN